ILVRADERPRHAIAVRPQRREAVVDRVRLAADRLELTLEPNLGVRRLRVVEEVAADEIDRLADCNLVRRHRGELGGLGPPASDETVAGYQHRDRADWDGLAHEAQGLQEARHRGSTGLQAT